MPVELLDGWIWTEEPVASSGHYKGYLPAEPPPTGDSGSMTGWVVKRRTKWKSIGTPNCTWSGGPLPTAQEGSRPPASFTQNNYTETVFS